MVKKLHLSTIRPYHNNIRVHGPKQIEALVKNIKINGYLSYIIVDTKNVIISGHGRHEALKEVYKGRDPLINVIVADKLTPKQVKAYRIADNKIAEMSEWELTNLDVELTSLLIKDGDEALIMGFNMEEINKIDREARKILNINYGPDPEKGKNKKRPGETFNFTFNFNQALKIRQKLRKLKGAKLIISDEEALYFLVTGLMFKKK